MSHAVSDYISAQKFGVIHEETECKWDNPVLDFWISCIVKAVFYSFPKLSHTHYTFPSPSFNIPHLLWKLSCHVKAPKKQTVTGLNWLSSWPQMEQVNPLTFFCC